MRQILLIIFIIETVFKINAQNLTIEKISYGSSFGECSGYCISNLTIYSTKINHIKESWQDEIYPPLKKTTKTNRNTWQALTKSVDLNVFFNLPSKIGCPDCTDQGAEWIEIKTKSKTHKITFEFNSKVKGLEILFILIYTKTCSLDKLFFHFSAESYFRI